MPDKFEVITQLKRLITTGQVTKDEVLSLFLQTAQDKPKKRTNFAEALYVIGAGIVFFGIVILIAQNWDELNTLTRIVTTLGAGLVAYMVGILLGSNPKGRGAGIAFQIIAALVLPVGFIVTFDTLGHEAWSPGSQSLIAAILMVMFLVAYFVAIKNELFMLFSILYGSWLFFAFTSHLIAGHAPETSEFFWYRVLGMGFVYLLLGYGLSRFELFKSLPRFLYSLGAIGLLGAALSLGGYTPSQNVFWELAFPALAFGVVVLSTYLKRRSLLTIATIFLMIYILKITAEYFSNQVGWPLSLVAAGLALIGIGYLSVLVTQKYIINR